MRQKRAAQLPDGVTLGGCLILGTPLAPRLAGPLSLLALASIHCEQTGPAAYIAAGGSPAGAPAVATPIAGAGGAAASAGSAGASTSSGAGGSAAAGSGGSAGSEVRGPTPAMAGVNFPFPQNRYSTYCSYPNYRNADVKAAYDKWKADTVTGRRRGRLLAREATQRGQPRAELHGLGGHRLRHAPRRLHERSIAVRRAVEVRAAVAGQKRTDGLVHQRKRQRPPGHRRRQRRGTKTWPGPLLMADRQWGGKGSLGDSYLNIAKKQIDLVYRDRDPGRKASQAGRYLGRLEHRESLLFCAFILPGVRQGHRQRQVEPGHRNLVRDAGEEFELGKQEHGPTASCPRGARATAHPTRTCSRLAREIRAMTPPPTTVRLVPHALPDRARLLPKRRATRAELRSEDESVLCRHRRQADRRRLQPRRHAPSPEPERAVRGLRRASGGRRDEQRQFLTLHSRWLR